MQFAFVGLMLALGEPMLATAEAAIDPSRRIELRSGPHTVVTESPAPAWADEISVQLEAVRAVLDERLSPASRAVDEPLRIVLLPDREAFLRFCMSPGVRSDCLTTGAMFYGPERLMIVESGGGRRSSLSALRHEATHAFLDDRFGQASGAPMWLGEGLAEVVSMSRVRRGSILPGQYCANTGRRLSRSKATIRELRHGIEIGRIRTDFEDLLQMDPRQFRQLTWQSDFYAVSWLLVDFLARDSARFATLVDRIIGGASSAEALGEIYEAWPTLHDDFRRQIEDFRLKRCRS